jgi:MFS family permease
MSSLDVSKAEIGLVATISSLTYGIGALAGGPLGDRIGEAKTISASLAFSGLATFIMIFAGFRGDIFTYAFALVIMAAFASLYHPTANSLISKAFKGRVSESMGLHGVGGTLGVVLTPTVAWLVGSSFGWPWAFVVFGVPCIPLGLMFAFSFGETSSNGDTRTSILEALRIRELWVLLIFNVSIGLFMKGIELFFPIYLKESRMVDPLWASIAYMLILAAGVPAQWIGGKSADEVGSRKVLVATSLGVCASLSFLLFFPNALVGIGIFIILYGFSFYAHQPALNSLTGFCCPPNQRGAVYGVFFFASFGVGSVSQVIVGVIGDLYGLETAFYLIAVFAVMALLLSLRLPKRRENGQK